MTVFEAYEFLRELIAEGKGDLPMYTEYEQVDHMREMVAESWHDGMITTMELGTPFVYVQVDH